MRALFILLLSFSLFGCGAAKTRVVLLEEASGKTGQVTLKTEGGSQTLTTKAHGVVAEGSAKPPSAPAPVSEEEIRALFGRAIDAQPEPPVTILLYFRMGETTLTPESQALLATVITEAAARPVPRIAIAGHTDTMGESDLNNTLARARAEAVAVKLQQAGLKPEEIIEVTSHGENNPLIPTGPNVAEPRNRRVEVIIQ